MTLWLYKILQGHSSIAPREPLLLMPPVSPEEQLMCYNWQSVEVVNMHDGFTNKQMPLKKKN